MVGYPGDNLVYTGTRRGHYAGTEYLAWMYKSKKPVYKQSVHIILNTEQGTVPAWEDHWPVLRRK